MARSQSTDFYHGFKYQVNVVTAGIEGASDIGSDGGFATAVMPEQTLEAVEYKEGIYLYRRKFPGDVTFSDITLTRGVAKARTAFWDWINACTTGNEYRVDLEIKHFHRDDVVGLADFTQATPKRVINCFECLPIRVKPGADFDAQASEVSLEEIDIALERFELVDSN
jgi:phage tail-like protein